MQEAHAAGLYFPEVESFIERGDLFRLGVNHYIVTASFRREFFNALHGVRQENGTIRAPLEICIDRLPAYQPATQKEVAGEFFCKFGRKSLHGQSKGGRE